MSRFFRASDSSSSEESDEESLYSQDEAETPKRPSTRTLGSDESGSEDDESDSDDFSDDEGDEDSDLSSDVGGGANRFLRSDDEDSSEDEDEEAVTVVRSARDKRFDEMDATVKTIENASKINDWAVISTEYDKLNRQLPQLQRISDGKTPKMYVKSVADLENLVNETVDKQKVSTKKMNALSTKGLNAVRQKIRKINRDFQNDIDAYRADPDEFMIEKAEKPAAEKAKKPKAGDINLASVTADEDDDEGWEGVGREGRPMKLTSEGILKLLRTILESRGRKNTDLLEQIKTLEKALGVCTSDYQRVRVLIATMAARMDMSTGTTNVMSIDHWKKCNNELKSLLALLANNPSLVVTETAEEWENDDKLPVIEQGKVFLVPGSILAIAERLGDEFTRSLQQIDPHTPEYIERLADEPEIYKNVIRVMAYLERIGGVEGVADQTAGLCTLVLRRIGHLYYKPEQVVSILELDVKNTTPELSQLKKAPAEAATPEALLRALGQFVFENDPRGSQAQCILFLVYYVANHDKYFEARDLLLSSHLQDTIQQHSVATMILFNRALVSVGLCAFRNGMIQEAQNHLQDICGSGRQKELLAQGVQMQRFYQITPEQERLEKARQLPFHMHINLELLECIYLTTSMLMEIPTLAATGSSPDVRRRVISKTFRKMLEYHERQIFTGPPENTRDHIMQASKALAAGEWRKSSDFISSIKIWDLMKEPEAIKKMLELQIQEDGLRTYLFTYAPFYDTLALSSLSAMFQLPVKKVSVIINRMISNEELAAALDQVGEVIVFRRGVELSKLQTLALSLSDKVSMLHNY